MCIPKDVREKLGYKYPNINHVFQMYKERGKHLFETNLLRDMIEETQRHIKNPMRCVICPDERENTKSNYFAMFLTDAGFFVVIPIFIDETNIYILTIKDPAQDDHINWHIEKYNEIGKPRGVSPLKLRFKGND